MSLLSQFTSSSPIKSIQRGIINLSTLSGNSVSVSISSVDTSKTILNFLGMRKNENNAASLNVMDAYISLTNSTTITATRNLSSSLSSTIISYEVIEFN